MFLIAKGLMAIYGLDPPYIYFNTGMYMYLATLGLLVLLVLAFAIHVIYNLVNKKLQKKV